MANRTFYRVGKGINDFVKKILDTNPDYIVPVKKKGCKLLKYVKEFPNDLCEKVRYKDYFENNDMDLKGIKIAVVDDATKYTSMLYKYRNFFEENGAIVDTYSYVGHKKLQTGEREQYDSKAYIETYLEESTYQEYLNQQAKVMVADNNFFDIDHFVVKLNTSMNGYENFLGVLGKIGNIEFVNDVYTPKNIEKISIINIDFYGAETLFEQGISQGALQKIRIAYNYVTEELFLAPLSFPNWNSNEGDRENIFSKVPFEVPYSNNKSITDEGIYFNIVYIFQLVLLKYFFNCIDPSFDTHKFEIVDRDLIAHIGEIRAASVIQSALHFLHSNITFENKKSAYKKKVIVPRNATTPFFTISELMSELRNHYNLLVNETKTLIGVRYFLAYEEIIERYRGNENIIKWVDILCDRGVLVTRNYCENGIYYRACRSGENNFDLLEKKSGIIVVMATNACGIKYLGKDNKWFCSISPTYLNKVLANFVYDYPSEEYDCHTLFSKPHNYGPLAYIEDKIGGKPELSLYSINKITEYCVYDDCKKQFVAFSNRNKDMKEILSEQVGQHDDIPYTELTAYLGFLKYVKEQARTDNFLNALSICRDQNTYGIHVYHNLQDAYQCIQKAKGHMVFTSAEIQLRQAAQSIKSAQTKLKYEQKEVKEFIENLELDMVYEQTQQKIVESFTLFDEKFNKEIIPMFIQVSNLEFLLANAMLYDCTNSTKYWRKMYKRYLQQDIIRNDSFDLINNMIIKHKVWNDEEYVHYKDLYNQLIESCSEAIIKRLTYLCEKDFAKKKGTQRRRNKQRVVNNIENYIYKQEYKNALILYYTFSGYKNLYEEKEVDVVKIVQEIVARKYEGGKLVYGAEENGYGVYVTDSLENAMVFVNELLIVSRRFSNVFFRFGCGYREVNYKNCKKSVEDALLEAQNSASKIKNENVLIMSKVTYENIKKVENSNDINLCKPWQSNNEYYVHKGVDIMNCKIKKYDTNTDETIKIGIITVLPEEHTAMFTMLENKQDVEFPGRGMGNQFVLGNIQALDGGTHRIALARTSGDGNNKAAIRAAKLLEHFPKLEVIFMVGIAGGTPILPAMYEDGGVNHLDMHVRLGDIVVSKGIFQYDYVKEKKEQFIPKGDNIPPCAKVVEAQQKLEEILEQNNDDVAPWNLYVKTALKQLKKNYERPDYVTDKLHNYNGELIEHPMDPTRKHEYPKIFIGKIASSNTVLKNPQKRDLLKKEHNVYAIEMETSGIADTTWEAGIGYYGVRGICDYCDDYKNDIWHRYAALVAAAYTKALIEWMAS